MTTPSSLTLEDWHQTMDISSRAHRGASSGFLLVSGFRSSLSPLLCFIMVFVVHVFYCDVLLMPYRNIRGPNTYLLLELHQNQGRDFLRTDNRDVRT